MAATETSPSDQLALTLAALYAAGEVQLLTGTTAAVKRLVITGVTAAEILPELRRLTRQVINTLAQGDPLVVQMVNQATIEGAVQAQRDVSRALAHRPQPPVRGGGGPPLPPGKALTGGGDEPFDLSLDHGEHAARAIIRDIDSALTDVRKRLTRLPDDIYKHIAPHGSIGNVRDNGVTPAQAQAAAWRVFVQNGVTGFTDRSGRDWSMSAYTEMAVRTGAQRAFNDSHLRRMQALGIRYFTIDEHKGACPLCYPWQHKVLVVGEPADPTVRVDATVDQAIAAGLFHPNCEHTLLPFFPGITKQDRLPLWNASHQDAYDATQRQRAIERDIRKAKRKALYAADPAEAKAARVKVRQQQKRMRDFLATRDDLARQSRREQPDFSNQKIKMPTLGDGAA